MYDNELNCENCVCLVERNGKTYCDELGKPTQCVDKCPEGCFDHNSNEKEYIVPVAWEMCGLLKVKASSALEAYEKIKYDIEDYALPEVSYYVDGSFEPSFDTEDMVEIYTEMYENGEINL